MLAGDHFTLHADIRMPHPAARVEGVVREREAGVPRLAPMRGIRRGDGWLAAQREEEASVWKGKDGAQERPLAGGDGQGGGTRAARAAATPAVVTGVVCRIDGRGDQYRATLAPILDGDCDERACRLRRGASAASQSLRMHNC